MFIPRILVLMAIALLGILALWLGDGLHVSALLGANKEDPGFVPGVLDLFAVVLFLGGVGLCGVAANTFVRLDSFAFDDRDDCQALLFAAVGFNFLFFSVGATASPISRFGWMPWHWNTGGWFALALGLLTLSYVSWKLLGEPLFDRTARAAS